MLKPIASDVWHLGASPLRMPGGVRMPIASTVIRLPDRSLLVYSPVEPTEPVVAALAELGEVAHVVAPSLLHHLQVATTLARFPRAKLHAPPSLARKRTDLTIDRPLDSPDPAWGDALGVVAIEGAPKLDEAVLFHRPSGTLICADLVFHVTRPANLRTRAVLALMGVGGQRLAQSRVWRFAVRDRPRTRASLDRLLALPIRRIAPSHGDPIEIDAAALAPRLSRAYGGVAPLLRQLPHRG